MHIEALRAYCLSKPGTSEGFPFDEVTLVFKVMGKIFAITSLERQPPQVNLKADPERSVELREAYEGRIIPGYHMNKKHWNTVCYNALPETLVRELIDHSYTLVAASLPAKLRKALFEQS